MQERGSAQERHHVAPHTRERRGGLGRLLPSVLAYHVMPPVSNATLVGDNGRT